MYVNEIITGILGFAVWVGLWCLIPYRIIRYWDLESKDYDEYLCAALGCTTAMCAIGSAALIIHWLVEYGKL